MLIQPLLRTTWPYIVNNLFTVLFPGFSDLIYQANHQMLSVTNLYSIFPAYHDATYHNVFGNQYSYVPCIHHPKAWHSGAAIVNFAFTVHWNWLVSWLVQSFTELSPSWMDIPFPRYKNDSTTFTFRFPQNTWSTGLPSLAQAKPRHLLHFKKLGIA